MIVFGGTTTVLAGFLSQVWGSAGVAFRTELAQSLVGFGILFTCTFALYPLRLYQDLPQPLQTRRQIIAGLAWVMIAIVLFSLYIREFDRLGDIILKYARISSP